MKISFFALLALLSGMAQAACDPRGGAHACVPGNYKVFLKVGDKTLEDAISITHITRRPGMGNLVEHFRGTYSVPGGFTVELEKGMAMDYNSHRDLSFKITADENNMYYPVYFKVTENGRCRYNGKAFLDEANTEHFADVSMLKQSDECL